MQTGHATSPRGADVLAVGLAATVAMWLVFYLAAIPPGLLPKPVMAIAHAAILFGAGWVLGRFAGRGVIGGLVLGALVAAIHVLVFLSLVADRDGGGAPSGAAKWIAGFLVASLVLCAAGSALGRARHRAGDSVNWTAALAWVTAITTLMMLVAGGIVTGLEAGLAVEGWLFAEGYFMVLFPVSMMQRDVATFVEHAHRLWGLLVGLGMILLVVHVWMVDARAWLRGAVAAVLLAVVGQGVLGGTRVTEQSVALGIAHGIVAQAIFAAVVLVAMATASAWTGPAPAVAHRGAATDRALSIALVAMVLVQITLGTVFRHLQPVEGVPHGALIGILHGHSFVGSLLVVVLVLFVGVRAWSMYGDVPIVQRSGKALIHTMILQVLLGVASFVVVPKGPRPPAEDAIPVLEVVLTTAHQVTGALLLAMAVTFAAWHRRLVYCPPKSVSSSASSR